MAALSFSALLLRRGSCARARVAIIGILTLARCLRALSRAQAPSLSDPGGNRSAGPSYDAAINGRDYIRPRLHDRQDWRKVGRSIRVERLRMPKHLTHVEADGSVRMVDVGAKPSTARTATAEALVRMSSGALRALKSGALKKGDALAVARIAGIQAAKRTAELVPLAHPLPITHVEVACEFRDATTMHVSCTVSVNAQTGVEMEALVGAAIAALTIYDMCKAMDRGITIEYLRLLEKRGGKSGAYRRDGRRKVDRSK